MKLLTCVLVFITIAAWIPAPTQAQAFTTMLIYADADGNIVHYDSSADETTILVPAEAGLTYDYKIIPSSDHLFAAVYSQSTNAKHTGQEYDFHLYIFKLFNGDLLLSHDLLPADFVLSESGREDRQSIELFSALVVNPPVWSPDNEKLVWVEAVSGGDATLAVWDVETGAITTLPDAPDYPYSMTWSPDSAKIVYVGVSTFGTGAGFSVTDSYVVTPDGTASERLSLKPSDGHMRDFYILGWRAPDTFIGSWFDPCGAAGFFEYNLTDHTSREILSDAVKIDGQQIAWDAGTNKLVFSITDNNPDTELRNGTYILDVDDGTPRLLEDRDTQLQALGNGYIFLDSNTVLDLRNDVKINLPVDDLYDRRFAVSGSRILIQGADGNVILFDLSTQDSTPLIEGRFVNAEWMYEDLYYLFLVSDGETTTLYQGDALGNVYKIKSGVRMPFVGFLPG